MSESRLGVGYHFHMSILAPAADFYVHQNSPKTLFYERVRKVRMNVIVLLVMQTYIFEPPQSGRSLLTTGHKVHRRCS